MAYLNVYISYWKDAVDAADEGDEIGTPKRRSDFFYPGRSAFRVFHKMVEAGELDAVQTDWAGWVARVTKKQIREFSKPLLEQSPPEHLTPAHEALGTFIDELDDDETYALVATEL